MSVTFRARRHIFYMPVWLRVRARLLCLPLNIVPADQELSELAGELKAVKKMSLADGFAAALAKREKAEIYTGDSEFNTVEQELKSFGYRSFLRSKQIHNTQSRPF